MKLKLLPVLILLIFISGCFGDGSDDDYAVSGTIKIASGTAVDSDVNDPKADRSDNGSFTRAQSVMSPVSLGGYVNEYTDEDDYFRMTLYKNDTVILSYPEGTLTLELYNSNRVLVQRNSASSRRKIIEIVEDGVYYVRVNAVNGGTNYVLNTGINSSGSSVAATSRAADFVPGDVIVRFREDRVAAGASSSAVRNIESLGLSSIAGTAGRPMLFQLGDDDERRAAFANAGITDLSDDDDSVERLKEDTLTLIETLNAREDVLYAEPNYIRKTFTVTPDDYYYRYQWHYPLINLPQAWSETKGSSDVVVAVIDTGVLVDHPDLQGQLVDGYDFISGVDNAQDGDGIDNNPDDPGDDKDSNNSSFHGTHVAGTVAAETWSDPTGVAGVAGLCRIMPLRVVGKDGATTYDIIQAVYYAAGLPNDSGEVPSNKAAVINLSLGGFQASQAEESAMNSARGEGVIVVAAAGNEGSTVKNYPAGYTNVVAVSAVDMVKQIAPYSNYGTWIDVAAPGGDMSYDRNGDGYPDGVISTCGDDSSGTIKYVYSFMEGTSMATPHVSGIAALMKSVNPNMTPAMFDMLLSNGQITDDIGATGVDNFFGNGLINAYKAVTAVGGEEVDPVLVVTPSSLNFGLYDSSITLTVKNGGGGSLSITTVDKDASWLSVSRLDTDSNGVGTYEVTVNRTGLDDGTYYGNIRFRWRTDVSQEPVDVAVNMQVDNSPVKSDDAGYLYVLLIDAETGQPVKQVEVKASNGEYTYRFSGIDAGSYEVSAGTDNDNDGMIGDSGEAYGSYKTIGSTVPVDVGGLVSGIDFTTSYQAVFPASVEATETVTVTGDRDMKSVYAPLKSVAGSM